MAGGWATTQTIKNPGFGVPASFSRRTCTGDTFGVATGQLNKYRIRPAILNEHAESSRDEQAVVTSSLIVGQVFKASQDNINGIMLTLESAAGATLDDFESYADSAALQAVWIETDAADPATLETTIVKGGTQAMALPLSATVADEWQDSVSSTDYTGYTFEVDYYQTNNYSQAKLSFYIGDGTNTKSTSLVTAAPNVWQHFELLESNMSEDGGGTTDVTAITEIGFRLTDRHAGAVGYIDNLTATPAPGSVSLKIWDMGASIPVTAVTSIDDGTQYTQIGDRGILGAVVAALDVPLIGGKRLYTVKGFACGTAPEIPANTMLTAGNYYALTINYVDTNVSVYGPDSSIRNYYTNGFAFTAPDEATAITALGADNDCMFGIYSTADIYINRLIKDYNAEPGADATDQVFTEDQYMNITDIIKGNGHPPQDSAIDYLDRKYFMAKGGKFEVYHNSDGTDSVTQADVAMCYMFEPPTVNG